MKDLRGKVAVVTGAGSGMGRAMAVRFAEEGCSVVLADVDVPGLDETAGLIVATGGVAVIQPTDVSDRDQIAALAARTILEFGAVHILCNNAGVETGGWFDEIAPAAWDWVLDVNLKGVINGCSVFLPLLRAAGEGHIVNTGSLSSFHAREPLTFAPYSASKFAVLALSESLAAELVERGDRIGVSILTPGVVRTKMVHAERNRPAGVPGTREIPLRDQVLSGIAELTDREGMEPSVVADLVVDAIVNDEFFVLTHPEPAIAALEGRAAEAREAATRQALRAAAKSA